MAFWLMSATLAAPENIDPDNDDSQYAWAENMGWINAEPSGDGGPGVQVGDDELSGWTWAENTGWISLSCKNTLSCATVDYGVTNDGAGLLAGYCWAENVGWISVSCSNTSSCGTSSYGVTIDPSTGDFGGFAWGENIGWVSFNCSNTSSCASLDFSVRPALPLAAGGLGISRFPCEVLPCVLGVSDRAGSARVSR